jgi:hypothetical protein
LGTAPHCLPLERLSSLDEHSKLFSSSLVGGARRKKPSSYEATAALTGAIEQLSARVEVLGRGMDEDQRLRRSTSRCIDLDTLDTAVTKLPEGVERGGRQADGGVESRTVGQLERCAETMELLIEQVGEMQRGRNEESAARQRYLEEQALQTQALSEMVCALRSIKSPMSPTQSLDEFDFDRCRPHPRYRPSVGIDCRIYEFPEVQVRLKIYQVGNVDTSRMTFEIDFLCRLDWCDPNVDGIDAEELKALDWDRYFNPRIEIDNCKDICTWMPGGDIIPRRRTFHSGASSGSLDGCGPWLHKTMRFRGTLALSSVNLRCFPFDIQVLPIRLKAARCPALTPGTPAANVDRARERIGRVPLVDQGDIPHELSYWATSPHLRARGHCALAAADETLLEFNISGLTGCHPDAKRGDVYEVHILVERPKFASYVWEMVIMNVLVLLAATAFWDTAAPELSSRMSISLTIILTLAAYTSARPAPIEKAPYVTFHDWWEQVCMLLVTGISVQNVFAVVLCGGQHEEAPAYMAEMFERNEEICSVGWCYSRNIDCRGLVYLLIAWITLLAYSLLWLARTRRATHGLWSKLLAIPCATAQADVDDSENEGGEAKSVNGTCMISGRGRCCCFRRKWCCWQQKSRRSSCSADVLEVRPAILHPEAPSEGADAEASPRPSRLGSGDNLCTAALRVRPPELEYSRSDDRPRAMASPADSGGVGAVAQSPRHSSKLASSLTLSASSPTSSESIHDVASRGSFECQHTAVGSGYQQMAE